MTYRSNVIHVTTEKFNVLHSYLQIQLLLSRAYKTNGRLLSLNTAFHTLYRLEQLGFHFSVKDLNIILYC